MCFCFRTSRSSLVLLLLGRQLVGALALDALDFRQQLLLPNAHVAHVMLLDQRLAARTVLVVAPRRRHAIHVAANALARVSARRPSASLSLFHRKQTRQTRACVRLRVRVRARPRT